MPDPTDVKIKRPDGTWVSLKGPQGPQGPAGTAGTAGAAGAPGTPGTNGTNGRSVATFDQASEPGAAVAGDFWFVP